MIWRRVFDFSPNFRSRPLRSIAWGTHSSMFGKLVCRRSFWPMTTRSYSTGWNDLSGAGDFEIVASCRDGSAALPIIRDKKPDLPSWTLICQV